MWINNITVKNDFWIHFVTNVHNGLHMLYNSMWSPLVFAKKTTRHYHVTWTRASPMAVFVGSFIVKWKLLCNGFVSRFELIMNTLLPCTNLTIPRQIKCHRFPFGFLRREDDTVFTRGQDGVNTENFFVKFMVRSNFCHSWFG